MIHLLLLSPLPHSLDPLLLEVGPDPLAVGSLLILHLPHVLLALVSLGEDQLHVAQEMPVKLDQAGAAQA